MKRLNKYEEALRENGVGSCLESLSDDGFCPNLINDDNGAWALVFEGFQSIRMKKSDDLSTSFNVKAKMFKPTVLKAIKHQIKDL